VCPLLSIVTANPEWCVVVAKQSTILVHHILFYSLRIFLLSITQKNQNWIVIFFFFFFQVRISDLIGPSGIVSRITFSDTDNRLGYISGTVSFLASTDTTIDAYQVYQSRAQSKKNDFTDVLLLFFVRSNTISCTVNSKSACAMFIGREV
jgi:hypothetical protein